MAASVYTLRAPRVLATLVLLSLAALAVPDGVWAQATSARSAADGSAAAPGPLGVAAPVLTGLAASSTDVAEPPADVAAPSTDVAEPPMATGLASSLGAEPDDWPVRSGGFLDRQLRNPRVQRAYEEKAERVQEVLEAGGVEVVGEIFFRVFKREKELEVWGREPGAQTFTLLKAYPVCEVSGELGPKRRQGDLQIPEGFYTIDVFNPASRFHLSMRVDYPNAVDRERNPGEALGGDIYIHGGCATIGCVPVTDEYIEELYLVAAAARDAGQRRIPVHIFPTRLGEDGVDWLATTYGADHADHAFWQNLKEGYEAFERTRVVPRVGYDRDRYTFAPPRTRAPLGAPVLAGPGLEERAAPTLDPHVAAILDGVSAVAGRS